MKAKDLATLMVEARQGSEEAARELYDRYGSHVLRVVRKKLDPKLRAQVDSADLTQAVWASFFVNPSHAFQFETPEAVLAFLARLAQIKLIDLQRRRYGTLKYNVNRETSLEGEARSRALSVAAPDPSPLAIAAAHERMDRLLQKCPPHYRRALELLAEGNTHEEVAQELGISEKTIRRLLRRIQSGSFPLT